AYQGRCPHQGASLAEGEVDGSHLVCRNHGWRFDIENGQRVGDDQVRLRPCPIREQGGLVLALRTALAASPAAAAAPRALRQLRDLPGPRGFPLVGNALQLDLDRVHQVLEGWATVYGPLYRVRIGRQRGLAIADPGLVGVILRERPETYRRP